MRRKLSRIEKNLHRAELTVLERSEHVAEWVRLAGETEKKPAQLAPVSKGGRGIEGGINAATRALGIDRSEAQRAVKPEAKRVVVKRPNRVKLDLRTLNRFDTAAALWFVGCVKSEPAMSRTFVAYLRVSTDKQGKSGLGLEAQQAAIAAFLQPADKLLTPPYIEVESGKNSARPQLRSAMDHCRRTGATLLIARLDRLARNVRFISTLMEEGVPFLACDMPNATPFMLHVYAAVAEEEARAISRRTKAALAAAKARGVKLGGDRGYRPVAAPDAALGGAAVAREADHAAHRTLVAIEEVRAAHGADLSLQALARHLTEQGVATPRGGAWTATAVRRVLARVAA